MADNDVFNNFLRRALHLFPSFPNGGDVMRRQSVILAAFFALFLATFAPIRAQESASTDENAGIMLAATSGTAFTSLENYARDLAGLVEVSGYTYDTTYYELGLVNIPDPGAYDCWLWAGGLLHSITSSSGTVSRGGFLFQGVVVRLANGNWASTDGLASGNVAHGYWPVYFRVKDGVFTSASFYGTYANTGDITVQDAANFMSNLRSFLVDVKNLAITGAVVDSLDVARLNDFETYDADEGGVIDLVEWVRGGDLNDWIDDAPSFDSGCKCGAFCSCECVCGKWSGAECGGTPDDCKCHKHDETCTCADYCCACECSCEKCADGTHSAHQNGSDTCDGTTGDTIGFVGCDCHKTTEETECDCAKYCCKHTCKCEKCGDGEHSAHENGSATCDNTDGESGCSCHKSDDPENPDDEECECAKYCCLHTCACKKCGGGEHSAHGNGLPTCDGTTENTGCACHETTGDEEDCTCANYCCYHTCACKRCASLPAEKHSQHKNGSSTCNGTTGSGGCDCHESNGVGEFEAPEDQEFKAPEDEKNKEFINGREKFKPSIERLEKAFEDKYQIKNVTKYFSGDLTGALPSWEFELPGDYGVARVDFNDLKKYDEQLATVRAVLVALVYLLTAAYVLQSLRKLV